MYREPKSSNQLNMCLSGCGLKDIKNLNIRTSKFYSNGKFKTIQKYISTKISRYTVVINRTNILRLMFMNINEDPTFALPSPPLLKVMDLRLVGSGFRFQLQCLHVVKSMKLWVLKPYILGPQGYGSETCGFWVQVLVTVFANCKKFEIMDLQAYI